MTEWCKAICVW